ncbi:MAG: hypothetical protein KZQ88_10445 [Candidatus Thiodiazotropha sp. (ex Dulcina madagascariensis)]|nr:hypothetical protein [Candidatus Thiodiazotropha sp. (ex Dulcina madagascariensis)]MCU7926164.1 hypothetical protein [Candidatus Thiodiazotropha sp. (ex Dulcina madagascariensis)]
MVQRLLKIARQHGAETVFPEVRIGNRAALRRYEKLCFVQIDRRRNYSRQPITSGKRRW